MQRYYFVQNLEFTMIICRVINVQLSTLHVISCRMNNKNMKNVCHLTSNKYFGLMAVCDAEYALDM